MNLVLQLVILFSTGYSNHLFLTLIEQAALILSHNFIYLRRRRRRQTRQMITTLNIFFESNGRQQTVHATLIKTSINVLEILWKLNEIRYL